MRGRGLKLRGEQRKAPLGQVAHHAGAWIETRRRTVIILPGMGLNQYCSMFPTGVGMNRITTGKKHIFNHELPTGMIDSI